MNVLVLTAQAPFHRGGAEIFEEDLVSALRAAGVRADLLRLPVFPASPEHVLAQIQLARLSTIGGTGFGAIDRVIPLKFPAYLVPFPRKTLWLVHQFRLVYELWDEPGIGYAGLQGGGILRDAIQAADRFALAECEQRFAISRTVAERLSLFTGLQSEVLHPPVPNAAQYYAGEPRDYFFFPSRLSPLKRQMLVLEAMAATRQTVRVLFAGSADQEGADTELNAAIARLGLADRANYLGPIPETAKRGLYANCLAVVFPPRLEDFGFVAAEAMLSAKPVVCCSDSGEVCHVVADGETGLIAPPCPEGLADAMDALWADRPLARRLGQRARSAAEATLSQWSDVIPRLLA